MQTETQIVEACWLRLIALHGPLRLLDDLCPDEQRIALTEARVLHIVVKSDGFGSGYVTLRAPDPAIIELPRSRYVEDHLLTQAFLVFVTPLVLSELERGYLGNEWGTPWERWSEVPGLPDPPRRRCTTALLAEVSQLCPSYTVALKAWVPAENTLAFHERVLARAAAEELKQGRGDGLRAVFQAVDRFYPTRPSVDGRHEGPSVLMDQLLEHLIAGGVDTKEVESLLPQGLRRCWGIALEDRFCPPHDGFY